MRLTLLSLVLLALTAGWSWGQSVQLRYETIDQNQNLVSEVAVGDTFAFNVYAQDLRGLADGGVFAAYLDIQFDTSMAQLTGDIQYGSHYQNGLSGELTPSGFNNVGAFASAQNDEIVPGPLGASEYKIFSVPMQATTAGVLDFTGGPAGENPYYEVLLFGVNDAVDPADVQFGLGRLTVVPEPSAAVLFLLGCVVFGGCRLAKASRHRCPTRA